jgi:hypothetical protein
MEQITEEERDLLFNTWTSRDKVSFLNDIILNSNEPIATERLLYEVAQNIWENCIDRKLDLMSKNEIV